MWKICHRMKVQHQCRWNNDWTNLFLMLVTKSHNDRGLFVYILTRLWFQHGALSVQGSYFPIISNSFKEPSKNLRWLLPKKNEFYVRLMHLKTTKTAPGAALEAGRNEGANGGVAVEGEATYSLWDSYYCWWCLKTCHFFWSLLGFSWGYATIPLCNAFEVFLRFVCFKGIFVLLDENRPPQWE